MGNGRSACPKLSGLHAGYNGQDKWVSTPKGEGNLLNLSVVRIVGCNRHMKLESVVIAFQNNAVNVSLLLAHTPVKPPEWVWMRLRSLPQSNLGSARGG